MPKANEEERKDMEKERLNPINPSVGGGVLDIAHGGTGASTAKEARANLGALGGYTSSSLLMTKDIDNCENVLFLGDYTDGDVESYPKEIHGTVCLVLNFNVSSQEHEYGVQLAISFGSNVIAVRNKDYGGTWGEWKYI